MTRTGVSDDTDAFPEVNVENDPIRSIPRVQNFLVESAEETQSYADTVSKQRKIGGVFG